MGFNSDDYIETRWRDALYALQSHIKPPIWEPLAPKSAIMEACEYERAPWMQLPRWIEEYQDEDTPVSKVVDFGCGRGVLLALCRQILSGDPELIGVEANVDCIDSNTLGQFDIQLVAENFESMPSWGVLRGAQIVILAEVMQYLKYSAVALLRRIHDIMKPGGILLISTPDSKDMGRTFKFHESVADFAHSGTDPEIPLESQWYFSRRELELFLIGAGFKLDRFGYAGIGVKHMNMQASAL